MSFFLFFWLLPETPSKSCSTACSQALLQSGLLCEVYELQKQELESKLSSSLSGAAKHYDDENVEQTFADKAKCL